MLKDEGAGFADLLDAGDGKTGTGSSSHYLKSSGVADLSAHFGVEHGLVGDDKERVFLRMDFEHGRFAFVVVEAEEPGDGNGGDVEGADDGGFLRGAGAFLLLLHEFFETRHIHFHAEFGAEEFGEVDGETEGVVEFECDVSGEGSARVPRAAFRILRKVL